MKATRPLESAYIGLAIVGTVLPLAAFLPWLFTHGLNVPLFVQELYSTRIGAAAGWDLAVSAVVVLIAAITSRDVLARTQQVSVIAGTLLVGVSLGLPLLLLFRERAR